MSPTSMSAARLIVVVGLVNAAGAGALLAQSTTRASVDSQGNQGTSSSEEASISGDGRFVAFVSYARLVPEDTNDWYDVFVHDRQTGETTRVSVDSQGKQANGESFYPSISADGRYVVFSSRAMNLVPDDRNGKWDVFVRDRQAGTTSRVSVSSYGTEGNNDSIGGYIGGGRYVAFASYATNLVPGDTNSFEDVFLHDLQTGQTYRVSVDAHGHQAVGHSFHAVLSADDKIIAFESTAPNLLDGDDVNGNETDIFVRDLQTGHLSRVNVSSQGQQGDHAAWLPSLSADGSVVTFTSVADDLVPDDTNFVSDIFAHDRRTHETTRISVDSNGNQGYRPSDHPCVSADGQIVVFDSWSGFVPTSPRYLNVFARDRRIGMTTIVSVNSQGAHGLGDSSTPSLSADGRFVAFESTAANLVPDDTNATRDVFVHDRQGDCPGDLGFILGAPPEVKIGTVFPIGTVAPAGNEIHLLASAGQGPTVTPYGVFCLDFPPAVIFSFVMPGEGGRNFYPHLPDDPSLIGTTGYMQFVAIDPSSGTARFSNRSNTTVVP